MGYTEGFTALRVANVTKPTTQESAATGIRAEAVPAAIVRMCSAL